MLRLTPRHTRVLAAAWAGLILALTLAPASGRPPPFAAADKVAHLALFLVWGAVLGRSNLTPARAFALGAALALATEGGQAALDACCAFGRHAEVLDAVADLLGLALGLAAARAGTRS